MMKRLSLIVLLLSAAGCSDEVFETRDQEVAQSGFWAPPADILALADTYNIENVQAGPWVGESGCGGAFLEGTSILREWLYEFFPQTPTIGGYSCRRIANSNSMSVHATGRALDIMLPVDGTAGAYNDSADNDIGDPIANWLLEHADELGVQLIIWDNMIWSSGRAPGERLRVYTNTNKHVDHIHMELNPQAAAKGTPWFQGPMGPPDLGPCGEPIPAEGGIVDDTDDCFSAYGPAEFWRVVDGQGHGGSLKWTNAWQNEEPSNWGRWRLNLVEGGTYNVEYYSVKEFAVYNSAQYRIRHNGTEDDVYVDLSAGEDGWQSLGEFEFAAGEDQWVSIFDNAPMEVGAEQHVMADAIRLVPPMTEITDPPVPGETDSPDNTGGPNPETPDGGERPPETPNEEDDDPEVIEAKGGCGCTTTGGDLDLAPMLGFLAVFGWRRRRR